MFILLGVSSDGKTIHFDEEFNYGHYGSFWQEGGDRVDLRGEVALLTRNIKFRGDVFGTERAIGYVGRPETEL